ncbi:hypothetical protein ACU4GD_40795 [Cupriavidus basilensis]
MGEGEDHEADPWIDAHWKPDELKAIRRQYAAIAARTAASFPARQPRRHRQASTRPTTSPTSPTSARAYRSSARATATLLDTISLITPLLNAIPNVVFFIKDFGRATWSPT